MSSGNWQPFCLGLNGLNKILVLPSPNTLLPLQYVMQGNVKAVNQADIYIYIYMYIYTVKLFCNDHLYNKMYYLWFIQ